MPQVDDVGTVFELTIMDQGAVVDISSETALQIIFDKPDGTTLTKTATLSTDGTDGKMRYVSTSGDLDQSGSWSWQGAVTLPAGAWKTDVLYFPVQKNL